MTTRDDPLRLDELRSIQLIGAERWRQITEESYDSTHDAGHADELADAAASYAQASAWRGDRVTQNPPPMWPWSVAAWKPTPRDRVRELVKAGALIAAAIDAALAAKEPNADYAAGVATAIAPDSLDAAWSRAEAALPEGWQMHLSHRADGTYSARAIDLVNADQPRASVEYAGPLPAPAAALLTLAEKLEAER